MPLLEATFGFNLDRFPGSCLAAGETLKIPASLVVDGHTVDLILTSRGSYRSGDSKVHRYVLGHVSAVVTVDIAPVNPDRYQSMAAEVDQANAVKSALLNALNRVLEYFRYVLRNPIPRHLEWTDVYDQKGFYAPDWKVNGEAVDFSMPATFGPGVSFLAEGLQFVDRSILGMRKFDEADPSELHRYVGEERRVSVFDQLLSDAQAALLANKVPRATLELALATEVLVKTAFFGADTPGYAALDMLPQLQITKLISTGARRAFGASFSDGPTSGNSKDIGHLFDARNSVAHKGVAQYWENDAKGPTAVTGKILDGWWTSVLVLQAWLEEKLASR